MRAEALMEHVAKSGPHPTPAPKGRGAVKPDLARFESLSLREKGWGEGRPSQDAYP